MSGFLGHLVQRSLTAEAEFRPRPVSLFESGQLSPAHDDLNVASFAREGADATGEPVRRDRQSAPATDRSPGTPAVSARVFADWPASMDTRPKVVASPQPLPLSGTAGEELPGDAREHNGQGRRDRRTSGVVHPESSAQAPIATQTPGTAAGSTDEARLAPNPVQPQQAETRGSHALPACEPSPAAQRFPGSSSIRAETSPAGAEQVGAAVRAALQVRGKRADPRNPGRAETGQVPTPGRHRPAAPVATVDNAHGESSDGTQTGRAGKERNPSRADHSHGVTRETASVTPEVILTPRISLPPVAQPVMPSASTPAEPTVHVTIGRVEIRAVSTPSVPKRPAPSKPALSLSDYLSRRNGGRG